MSSVERENRLLREKLSELTDWAARELEEARYPAPYQDSFHYVECGVKARVLDDLLVRLRRSGP